MVESLQSDLHHIQGIQNYLRSRIRHIPIIKECDGSIGHYGNHLIITFFGYRGERCHAELDRYTINLKSADNIARLLDNTVDGVIRDFEAMLPKNTAYMDSCGSTITHIPEGFMEDRPRQIAKKRPAKKSKSLGLKRLREEIDSWLEPVHNGIDRYMEGEQFNL